MRATPLGQSSALQWDLFCRVIDNFGDIGVCWRLACQLAARGQRVRLWVDDASALAWMAPGGCPGVELRPFSGLPAPGDRPGDVLVEAFGCDIPPAFIARCAERVALGAHRPVWINLEYLSAEAWVPRHHGLPSPVQHGPAAGWTKWFYYPGFTEATGGLLREPDLPERQRHFDRAAWRARQAASVPAPGAAQRWVSLFCYEPPALAEWLRQCEHGAGGPTLLLATPGRAQAAVQAVGAENTGQIGTQRLMVLGSKLSILNIPATPQEGYDELLWGCDLNFVRGEDSLVRALWAGQPLVWQIYPQDDGAHAPKLHAFLDWLQAPASLRVFHAVWNGLAPGQLPVVDAAMLQNWGDCVRAARARLLQQKDLLSQLLGFCAAKR